MNSRRSRFLPIMVASLVGLALPLTLGVRPAAALRPASLDSDSENKLWDCPTRHVPFGDLNPDKVRCISFRYSVPPGGVTSAYLHLDVNPSLGGDNTNDALYTAITKPINGCGEILGAMTGCAVLHGDGFAADKAHLNVDLMDIACDKSVTPDPEKQKAISEQLQTGVIHFLLQDDTAVLRAELVVNEGGLNGNCGTTATAATPTGSGSTGNPPPVTPACTSSGQLLPTPIGTPEPSATACMTLQAGQRNVRVGDVVSVPVYMINGHSVANINYELTYDPRVAFVERGLGRGSFLNKSLIQGNSEQTGKVLFGAAQTTGEDGTGSLTFMRFRAVGKPGDKTALHLKVTTLNDAGGTNLSIDLIDGSVQIVGPDGGLPGDCNGDSVLNEPDALCALQMSVELLPARLIMDMDNDNKVTSRDSAIILQRSVGRA